MISLSAFFLSFVPVLLLFFAYMYFCESFFFMSSSSSFSKVSSGYGTKFLFCPFQERRLRGDETKIYHNKN